MSHFTVAVFTKYGTDEEIKKLLAPYDEQPEDEQYLEFEPDEDGIEYDGYEGKGWLHNPNAKWDWWVIGGRWADMLKLKPGKYGVCGERSWTNRDKPHTPGTCDIAKVRDVDFAPNIDAYVKSIRFWELIVEKKPLRDGEEMPDNWYREGYYEEQYKTKENFAMSKAEFGTYAFVSSDGKWHGDARMGWWGADDNTYEKREKNRTELCEYIMNHPDEYIAIVDCHI